MCAVETNRPSLTKYPPASFRELVFLSLPLILSLLSSSIMGFCDRLYLAHYSMDSLHGCVSASYLSLLFQHPVIRIVVMSQVFVGLYYGSQQNKAIGSLIWQMIWLSLVSMAITYPIGEWIAPLVFKGTSAQNEATIYFTTMMKGNFLFPLGAAISSYFIGKGKVGIIVLTTLLSQGLNIGLDYFFIFGVEGFLPTMGIYGAALATVLSQALFCFILLLFFLRKKEREEFGTDQYRFHWSRFWEQTRVGIPRALARLLLLICWILIMRIVTLQGGDHLIVLSIGSSLILLFTFINDGMLQGLVTIASNLMGAKDYARIWQTVRSGAIFLFITTALLAIPYLVIPEWTISFFFTSETPSPQTCATLKNACIWLWLFFFCYGFETIGVSLITAARDTLFYLGSILITFVLSYTSVYYLIGTRFWPPDRLWLLMSLCSLLSGSVLLLRSLKERWKVTSTPIL